MKKCLAVILIAMLAASCNSIGVFEQTKALPNHAWATSDSLHFSFDIEDTASPYNVYVVLRHTEAYRYNNIYINVTAVGPGDSALTVQHNFVLANNAGWLGSAMDDVIEQRILINSAPAKLKKGKYTVGLKQIMRDDPLPHILNAGVRVEKAAMQ